MQAAQSPGPAATDRECLESWRRRRDPEGLRRLLERYAAFVHSSALRRTGDADQAAEVTRAVFLVLARRARRLRPRTVLADWLFQVTAIACRRVRGGHWLGRLWHRVAPRWPRASPPSDAALWTCVAPRIDRAVESLWTGRRRAVLLRAFLNHDAASAAAILGTSDLRVERRARVGIRRLAVRLRTRRMPVDPDALAQACATEGCAAGVPEELSRGIWRSTEQAVDRRPSLELARRTLRTLGWRRWRRRCLVGGAALGLVMALLVAVVVSVESRTGYSRLRAEGILLWARFRGWQAGEAVRSWPTDSSSPRLDAGRVRHAQDLYQTTNIWLGHLRFTREQWEALAFKRIGAMPDFMRPEGLVILRNPNARRSGLAGVLGFEFDWTHADFELGGVAFTNVAVRAKGNMRSLYEPDRAYKVDLNKHVPGQKLGDLDELTLNNLIWDCSGLAEALGYEFFRDAGVPAPRTAYAWLSATVATRWEQKPLGLYLMVETVNNKFAAEHFGSKSTPIFKPVTYSLFENLGEEWAAYAPIYDLKTKATPDQKRRVIEFAQLVSSASDAEFAARVGEYLDLDEFARFLAGQVLLPCYDGILSDGQNFYMYLDPRSNRLGFIPWDLDSAWGGIWLASSAEQARASIWHPWVGKNRFLERVMAVDEFRRVYRSHLEDFVTRLYVPERLHRRIDELAAVIRDPIAAQSPFRLDKLEQAVGWKPVHAPPTGLRSGPKFPEVREIKRFIDKRAQSVRRQLDGKSTGMILTLPNER